MGSVTPRLHCVRVLVNEAGCEPVFRGSIPPYTLGLTLVRVEGFEPSLSDSISDSPVYVPFVYAVRTTDPQSVNRGSTPLRDTS
jgi:hypothetical protein